MMRRINILWAIAAGPLLCTNPKFPYRVQVAADHQSAVLTIDGKVPEKGKLSCWVQTSHSWPYFEPSEDLTCQTQRQPENFYFVAFHERGEKLFASVNYIDESSLNLCTLFCVPGT